MQLKMLESKELLFETGSPGGTEYFVTQGVLRIFVLSPEGDEVTMGFFVGPVAGKLRCTPAYNTGFIRWTIVDSLHDAK